MDKIGMTIRLDRPYCVYVHRIQGVVFYVGQGTPSRPYAQTARPDRWRELVEAAGAYEVEIVETFITREGALSLERHLFDLYQPEANSWGEKSSANRRAARLGLPQAKSVADIARIRAYNIPRRVRIRCKETGSEYASILSASQELGIHQAQMSRHINNPMTTKTCKGLTFERVGEDHG